MKYQLPEGCKFKGRAIVLFQIAARDKRPLKDVCGHLGNGCGGKEVCELIPNHPDLFEYKGERNKDLGMCSL